MKNPILWSLILSLALLSSCKKTEARKPLAKSTESATKSSVERNKEQNKAEELLVKDFMAKDSLKQYISSNQGFWYIYEHQNVRDSVRPIKGNLVEYEYEVTDLDGNILYSKANIGVKSYLVDQEDLLIGLRQGLKLMKKDEVVSFVFPSHLAYGYSGDQDKIGINQPLVYRVRLIAIQNEK
ncbi:gliding motility-associated peptidyl-prolyl isomerase GldI [Flavobacterium sp. NKUCC04_CG]|uniref:gliding motility-associated peptidyl-prolyl isomerase GldI n=1 Tax=Flavobacterium sp. NKUCC04_CG TaxID=2842121 RepID=UPI001C5ABC9B|nr:gliding motility-associated peptidyl-prolyl isomerase GldI [Flavobacterium sp. NKUCC04_CG]MBW3519481.1 gliding motility-associated peptidyl-prolyl isomerase GldI [Flavobacterium sp. NKUCC04_CG]